MPDDTMFQEAIEALRRGDRTRAKEQLTLLLKAEQTNPTYWVWMSAAVDSTRERIYCLQTALNLDPENATAKRGLILLGALPPDENVQPFPINRPRAWEEKLLLAHEKPKPKGLKALTSNPAARLAGVIVLGVAVIGAAVFGLMMPRRNTAPPVSTRTMGPTPTFTFTPTFVNVTPQSTPTFLGPTPLWMLLPATYTPTPLYVNTPRDPRSYDQNRIAMEAYKAGDWDAFISNMKLVAEQEPDSADVFYMLGEGYRFQRNAREALFNYNHALEINPDFGPAYLGLARARLLQDPNANVEQLLQFAIDRDPNFGEIYLERARYYLHEKDPEAALEDLDQAKELMPDSADVYLTYANAYLALDDTQQALTAAEKSYSLDITILPTYILLGELYVADGQYEKGIEILETYAAQEPEDGRAFALIGQSYFDMKDYKSTIEYLDRAFRLNPNGLRKYNIYRGLAHLELGHADEAVADLEKAFSADETSFDVNLALVRAYFMQEKFGSAFLKVEACKSLAKTDEETALVHYWRALIQEKREEPRDAILEWKALLAMDEDVMTAEMRAAAEKHLKEIVTPTNSPTPGKTTITPTPGTKTLTPKPGATNTPRPGGTLTPTRTIRPGGTAPTGTPTP
jgi:tetratricopeptide (TPR) repeat protein